MYYLRSKSAADAIKFTVDHSFMKKPVEVAEEAVGPRPPKGETAAAAVKQPLL